MLLGLTLVAAAQSGRRPVRPPSPPPVPAAPPAPSGDPAPEPVPETVDEADPTPVSVSDDGTIRLDTTMVSIPLTVTDRAGRPIPHLRREQFRLYEDNVEQRIDALLTEAVPFHVMLLIDTSGSVREHLDQIQGAAMEFVRLLRPDDQVMVVTFATRVNVECDFSQDRMVLYDAIRGIRGGGGTRIYSAVDFALRRFQSIEGRKAIVLFSDGIDSMGRRSTGDGTLSRAEESGVLIYPIWYDTQSFFQGGYPGGGRSRRTPPIYFPGPRSPRGRWPLITSQWPGAGQQVPGERPEEIRRGREYLEGLADATGGRFHASRSLGSLNQTFGLIADELRQQYALRYYPTNTRRDGTYRTIRVRVTLAEAVVRARKGYRVPKE
jgi:Ca-activated chloride channel family protein